jgi:hypothetical protein
MAPTSAGTLEYNVAFGDTITLRGGGTAAAAKNKGRIYGNKSASATPSNNYARDNIIYLEFPGYNDLTPGAGSGIFTTNIALTDVNGASAATTDMRANTFWTGKGFTASAGATKEWSYSLISQGYPTLTGLGGQ